VNNIFFTVIVTLAILSLYVIHQKYRYRKGNESSISNLTDRTKVSDDTPSKIWSPPRWFWALTIVILVIVIIYFLFDSNITISTSTKDPYWEWFTALPLSLKILALLPISIIFMGGIKAVRSNESSGSVMMFKGALGLIIIFLAINAMGKYDFDVDVPTEPQKQQWDWQLDWEDVTISPGENLTFSKDGMCVVENSTTQVRKKDSGKIIYRNAPKSRTVSANKTLSEPTTFRVWYYKAQKSCVADFDKMVKLKKFAYTY